jgi:hypothetical protein
LVDGDPFPNRRHSPHIKVASNGGLQPDETLSIALGSVQRETGEAAAVAPGEDPEIVNVALSQDTPSNLVQILTFTGQLVAAIERAGRGCQPLRSEVTHVHLGLSFSPLLFARLGRLHIDGRHVGRPGLAGFGFVFDRFPRHVRDGDEMIAAGTLDLPAGELFLALQMLLAMRALEFEFAHGLVMV